MKRILPALLLFLAAPAFAETRLYEFAPEVRYILPIEKGVQLLHQCSRAAPENVTEFWRPPAGEIAQLESALPDYLLSLDEKIAPPGGNYARQYMGIVTGGKRLIYGNYFYVRNSDTADRSVEPAIVCDGGPYFWGIVYDSESNEFKDLELNGGL
jgi:hypothetical protein